MFKIINFILFNAVPTIEFETDLSLQGIFNDLQLNSALIILNYFFYIAIAIGGINVIRTFVFAPDKIKKVVTNYIIGIIAFSIISNFLGLQNL